MDFCTHTHTTYTKYPTHIQSVMYGCIFYQLLPQNFKTLFTLARPQLDRTRTQLTIWVNTCRQTTGAPTRVRKRLHCCVEGRTRFRAGRTSNRWCGTWRYSILGRGGNPLRNLDLQQGCAWLNYWQRKYILPNDGSLGHQTGSSGGVNGEL